MKIEQSASRTESVVNNGYAQNRLENGANSTENGKVKNGSINAAGLNFFDDEIANRKQKAVQDAMQFVKDQFEADGTIDNVLETCRDHSAESRGNLKEACENLGVLEEEREQMKEAYGGEDTEEYKAYLKNYNQEKATWAEQRDKAQKDIALQSATIRGVKQEILKQHGMDDAEKARDMMLEAAGKEVTGMLVEEAKEKIDETIKDAVEKGEEKKEETEEMEDNLEKVQAELKKRAKEIEDKAEVAHKNNTMSGGGSYNHIDMDRLQQEMERHTSRVLEEMSLLPEDIKGAVVDDLL